MIVTQTLLGNRSEHLAEDRLLLAGRLRAEDFAGETGEFFVVAMGRFERCRELLEESFHVTHRLAAIDQDGVFAVGDHAGMTRGAGHTQSRDFAVIGGVLDETDRHRVRIVR